MSAVDAEAQGRYAICVSSCPQSCIQYVDGNEVGEQLIWGPNCGLSRDGLNWDSDHPDSSSEIVAGGGGTGAGGPSGAGGGGAVERGFAARGTSYIGVAALILTQLQRDGGTVEAARAGSKVDEVRTSLVNRAVALEASAAKAAGALGDVAAAVTLHSRGSIAEVNTQTAVLVEELSKARVKVDAQQKDLEAGSPFGDTYARGVVGLVGGEVQRAMSTLPLTPARSLPSFLASSTVGVSPLQSWEGYERSQVLPQDTDPRVANAYKLAMSGVAFILARPAPGSGPVVETLLGEAAALRTQRSAGAELPERVCRKTAHDEWVSVKAWPPDGDEQNCLTTLLHGLALRQGVLETAHDEVAGRVEAGGPEWSRLSLRGAAEFLSGSALALRTGRVDDARELQSIAESLLDVATATLPMVSLFRDAIEATIGTSLITGEPLDPASRTAAVWSVLTFGIGGRLSRPAIFMAGSAEGRAALRRIGPVPQGLIRPLEEIPMVASRRQQFAEMAQSMGESPNELLRRFGHEGTAYRDLLPKNNSNINVLLRDPRGPRFLRVTLEPGGGAIRSVGVLKGDAPRKYLDSGRFVPLITKP